MAKTMSLGVIFQSLKISVQPNLICYLCIAVFHRMVEKGLISVATTTVVVVIVGKQVVEKVPCNRNANKNEKKGENLEN